MKIVNQSKSKK